MSAMEIEPTVTFAFMLLSCHIHCTDKYSQHSSIIWPVWLNG